MEVGFSFYRFQNSLLVSKKLNQSWIPNRQTKMFFIMFSLHNFQTKGFKKKLRREAVVAEILEDDLVCFNPNNGAGLCVRHEPGGWWQIQNVLLWEHGFPFSFHVETLTLWSTACPMSLVQATVRRITAVEWVLPTSAWSRSRVGSCAFHCCSGLGGYQSKDCWEGNVRTRWPALLNYWVWFEYGCLWSGLH